jgi:hypothetical protein
MAHHLACKRIKAASIKALLPVKYFESLEQNQKIASCCRHPENHEVEAWYSSETDRDKGIPDIYKFHCTCGRVHTRFCVGHADVRPFWDVR